MMKKKLDQSMEIHASILLKSGVATWIRTSVMFGPTVLAYQGYAIKKKSVAVLIIDSAQHTSSRV